MKHHSHSHSSLFLIEILITILFLSLASTICIKIFVYAYQISKNSSELTQATIICENAIEIFESGNGSIHTLDNYYPFAQIDDYSLYQYYDKDFKFCTKENSSYCLVIELTKNEQNISADFYFRKYDVVSDRYVKTIYHLLSFRHIPIFIQRSSNNF